MAQVYKKNIPIVAPSFRLSRQGSTRTAQAGLGVREVAMATFDPSGNSAQRAIGSHNLGVYIPAKAIITNVWYDVITTFASATDAATIALTAQSAGDLVAAAAISAAGDIFDAGIRGTKVSNFALDGNALTQVGMAAAEAATFIKTTAERQLVATVAVEALTAGKMNIFVEYVQSA